MITNQSEFLQRAIKHYDNPKITSVDEFEADLKKFVTLNTLLGRYSGKIGQKERLILNYFVILRNCFGESVVDLMRFKISPENHSQMETYMFFLEMIPNGDIDFQLLVTLQEL